MWLFAKILIARQLIKIVFNWNFDCLVFYIKRNQIGGQNQREMRRKRDTEGKKYEIKAVDRETGKKGRVIKCN